MNKPEPKATPPNEPADAKLRGLWRSATHDQLFRALIPPESTESYEASQALQKTRTTK